MDKRREFDKRHQEWDQQLPDCCQNCGTEEDLIIHHIVPLAAGGNNVITNLARLCDPCHSKVHGKNVFHRKLQKLGIEKAKKEGKFKGRVKKYTKEHPGLKKAFELYDEGQMTVDQISAATEVSRSAIYRGLRARNKKETTRQSPSKTPTI